MKFNFFLFSLVIHDTYSFQQRISHRGRQVLSNPRYGWHLQSSVQTISRPLPTVPKDKNRQLVGEGYHPRAKRIVKDGRRLSRTIECGQKQLPFHIRVAKECSFQRAILLAQLSFFPNQLTLMLTFTIEIMLS